MNEDDLKSLGEENSNDRDNLNKEIQKLTEKSVALEKKIKTERFTWVLLAIVLFDAPYFQACSSWGAPVVLGVFELIMVLVFADKLEIRTMTGIVDRLFGVFDARRDLCGCRGRVFS